MRSRLLACITVALAVGLGTVLAGCGSRGGPPKSASAGLEKATQEKTAQDRTVQKVVEPRFAYAAGLGIGRRLRDMMEEDGLAADRDLIVRGMTDGLNDRPTLYPEAEMEDAIVKIEMRVRQRRAEKQYEQDPTFRKMADENLKASQESLARAAMMEGVETLPSGLLVQAVTKGDGRYVANAPTITVNFRLSLADKTVVRSSEPGMPSTVRMSRLPEHLAAVVREMKVGDKCRIALPPEKAYGLAGLPPVIGPNQGLLLELDLVGVEDPAYPVKEMP